MGRLKILLRSVLFVFILLPLNLLGQAPRTASAEATVVNGFVVSITVTDGGFGYTSAPTVRIISSSGSGAVAVATVSNGAVEKIVVLEVGSGYGPNPMISISAPAASRTATATATVVNGFLVSVSVTDGGFGYSFAPPVQIEGGAGSGAVVKPVIVNGAVNQLVVENAGKGYPADTKITIAAPGEQTAAPFAEGLIAYYPCSSNSRDESGNGNDGAILDAGFGADRFGVNGKSLSFPGLAYVFVNNTPSLENLGYLTISAWVKHSGIPAGSSGMSIISKVSDDSSALSWNAAIVPPGRLRVCANAGGWGYFDCNTILEPGVWHHVAMVYNGSQLMGFVDGVLDGAGGLKGPIAPSNRPVRIGVYSPNLEPDKTMFFTGQIDDIRIYNRPLSGEELSDLYHFEAPEGPWVELAVKTVQVTLHVKPNKTYQVQTSVNVTDWTDVGEPFVAISSSEVREFDVAEAGRYFRVHEVR